MEFHDLWFLPPQGNFYTFVKNCENGETFGFTKILDWVKSMLCKNMFLQFLSYGSSIL